jgi:hypothetical protein
MKTFKLLLFITILISNFSSCVKEDEFGNDYRDKYCGEYECSFLATSWNIGTSLTIDTITNVIDTLSVEKSKLSVKNLKIQGKNYRISDSGTFKLTENYSEFNYYIEEINFRNDSIFIFRNYAEKNAGTTVQICGVKQ